MKETTRWDDLANLTFPNSYPTKEAADKLRDELLFERAVQVYLWALPAVNLMAMKEGSEKAFGAGLQRVSCLERAAQRKDDRYHTKLRRDLCDGLC
jgi:hypothetical protein